MPIRRSQSTTQDKFPGKITPLKVQDRLKKMWGSDFVIKRSWHPKVQRALYFGDFFAIAVAVVAAHLIRFGWENADLPYVNVWPINVLDGRVPAMDYIFLGIGLTVGWWFILQVNGSRSLRIMGFGTEEYRLITRGSTYFFCLLIIVAFFLKVDVTRMYLLIAYPLGLFFLLMERWVIRQGLVRSRTRGRALTRVMIISDVTTGQHLYKNLKDVVASGLSPAAFYLPGFTPGTTVAGAPIPVLGYSTSPADIMEAIRENDIHMVAVTNGHHLSPDQVRLLGWKLADAHISLIMAPATTDIAGPRMHMQPMNGLPLVHVSTPRITGLSAFFKRAVDVVSSGLGLILLSPLFLVVALLVKRDGGPVFFLQNRVGLNGELFKMVKFRSMRTDAEEVKKRLMEQNEGNGVLFKMKDDPRITPIGKFIRKYSIDELPQLWNVFIGDMSLVGPRPPLVEEVEQYEDIAYRRLLVKPGITGLWQVSGRSDLSWEESVRLDLYYVENWSLTGDFIILLRTVRAVFAKEGAY